MVVYKVLLTREQFQKLVKGEILKIVPGPVFQNDVVELGLSDIGFGIMKHVVEEAERDANEKSPGNNPAVSG